MRRTSLAALLLTGAVLAAPGHKSREQIIDRAMSLKGTPYVWAGTTAKGFDCSGFIYRMMLDGGYEVPRMADDQFYATHRVQRKELRRGDLVFFTTYLPGPSHVGIFLGEGKFVHASSAGGGVIVSQMNDGYYSKAFIGGGRPNGYPAPEGPAVAAEPHKPAAPAVALAAKSADSGVWVATHPPDLSAFEPAPVMAEAPAPAASPAPPVATEPSPAAPVAVEPSPEAPVATAPSPAAPVAAEPSPVAPVAVEPSPPALVASDAPPAVQAASYAVEIAPDIVDVPSEPTLTGRPRVEPGAPVILTDAGPPTMVASAPSPTPLPTEATLPPDLAAPRGVQFDWPVLSRVWQLVSGWFG